MKTDNDVFPVRNTRPLAQDQQVWNWAHNARLGARDAVLRPENEEQLRQMVLSCPGHIKVLGSRLSPGQLVRIDRPEDTLIDPGHFSGLIATQGDNFTFGAATTLHQVFGELKRRGRMLAASPGVIDNQTLAGAIATGTHGQGLQQSSLSDEVLALRMVLADGRIVDFDHHHPSFGALKLSLGALGVVTQITLRTVALQLYTCFKSAVSAADLQTQLYQWNEQYQYSKTWWFPQQDQVHVWCAREATGREQQLYHDADAGDNAVSFSDGDDSLNTTIEQTLTHMEKDTRIKGEQGVHFKTVTRFKDFSDIVGDIYQIFCRGIAAPQINIEMGIPLSRAGAVIEKIKAWCDATHPHMHYPIILRCTGKSSAWLSPSWGEATCFFGFVVYYADDGSLSPEGTEFLAGVEKLLANEGGRPHWGKYFNRQLYDWSACYPRWQDFLAVKNALDPQGKFSNTFTRDLFN